MGNGEESDGAMVSNYSPQPQYWLLPPEKRVMELPPATGKAWLRGTKGDKETRRKVRAVGSLSEGHFVLLEKMKNEKKTVLFTGKMLS